MRLLILHRASRIIRSSLPADRYTIAFSLASVLSYPGTYRNMLYATRYTYVHMLRTASVSFWKLDTIWVRTLSCLHSLYFPYFLIRPRRCLPCLVSPISCTVSLHLVFTSYVILRLLVSYSSLYLSRLTLSVELFLV